MEGQDVLVVLAVGIVWGFRGAFPNFIYPTHTQMLTVRQTS